MTAIQVSSGLLDSAQTAYRRGAMSDRTVLVGIDCATSAKLVGLAKGVIERGEARVDEIAMVSSWDKIDDRLAKWLEEPALIALDAPLGWPRALGSTLSRHRAGDVIKSEAHALFRRFTDDVVARDIKKRSLDVGADRIARTAHSALALLGRLRTRLDESIPLAWVPAPVQTTSAIEVYPAATLAGRGWPNVGYKSGKEGGEAVRRAIVAHLDDALAFDAAARERMIASDHALDAVLCILAGADFVRGEVIAPADRKTAEGEGWIWVRPSFAEHEPLDI